MAGSALLEREIINQASVPVKEREITTEEREHRERISKNYDIFRYRDNMQWADPSVRDDDRASAAYTEPVKEKKVSLMPDEPALSVKRGGLFENVDYINGELVYTRTSDMPAATAPEAAVAEPTYTADNAFTVAAPAEPVSEDDALPTRRTMDTLSRTMSADAEAEVKRGVLSALSLKTKIVLASIVAIIVLAIAIICVNTGFINSLDAQLNDLKARAVEQQQTYEGLKDEVESFNDPDNETVRLWAEEHGMTRP